MTMQMIHGIRFLRHLAFAFICTVLAGALTAPAYAEDAPVPNPAWTVPAGWVKAEGQKPMRVATFTVTDGEVVISQFGGNAGGLLANVNRWRGQLGLGPVTAEQLPEVAPQFEIPIPGKAPVAGEAPAFAGSVMHLKGAEKHMLGAIVYEPQADRTWFVKLIGTQALTDQHEAAFTAFVKSFVPGK